MTMISPMTTSQITGVSDKERRSTNDRRFQSTPALGRYSHRGERQHARRLSDSTSTNGYYVDKYESKMLFIILSILILCIADAYITTLIIAKGGEELNLLMEILIKESLFIFIIGKYLMTSGSLIFLVAHRNFNVFYGLKVTDVLSGILCIYIFLIGYEISILTNANLISF